MRRRVLEDLRDSPWKSHRLHLPSYLRGARGQSIAAAAAVRGGVGIDRILSAAATRGGLEIVMPRAGDRLSWTGTGDVVVKGSVNTRAERSQPGPGPEHGYTTAGERRPFGYFDEAPFPFITLRPAEESFGSDPEAARAAALPQSRGTVSAPDGEWREMRTRASTVASGVRLSSEPGDQCNEELAIEPCDGGGFVPGSWGTSVGGGQTEASCYQPGIGASADADGDGVVDSCEYDLADAFRPFLAQSTADCNLGREPYWGVRYGPGSSGAPSFIIFSALSYYYDCGSPRPDCFYSRGPHRGDSEFIVLQVSQVQGGVSKWVLDYATLSAHWGTEADYTATYAGQDLDYGSYDWRVRPLVWVAEGKHANYRSRSVCDSGAGYYDNCDRNVDHGATLDILPWANLGQSAFPFIGANAPVPSRAGAPGGEYFWTNNRFLGWDAVPSASGSSSPYLESLSAAGF